MIDVVSDASVALKWFHSEGEDELVQSRHLLQAYQSGEVALSVLDLTTYEIGNALLRGRAKANATQVTIVLQALLEICPVIRPDADDLVLAAELAQRHSLTLHDAAYAAVAQRRRASLVTTDPQLLAAGLGLRPSELVDRLPTSHT